MLTTYDISVPLHPDMVLWPGSYGVHRHRTLEPDANNVITISRLDLCMHSGTHIDAPLHFIPGTGTTAEIPLQQLVGPCYVADFRGKAVITAADLKALELPANVHKLLLKTDNSNFWNDPEHRFNTGYCALTLDAAQWVAQSPIHLIGIDYLSIQLFDGPDETHVALLKDGVVILETLDLREVPPGYYQLYCLPLKVQGVEGVPVRAILQDAMQ